MSNIKKVVISLDDSVLSDIDSQAKIRHLSRSAFIRYLFYSYLDCSNIIAGYEIQNHLLKQELSQNHFLKQELSRFKDVK